MPPKKKRAPVRAKPVKKKKAKPLRGKRAKPLRKKRAETAKKAVKRAKPIKKKKAAKKARAPKTAALGKTAVKKKKTAAKKALRRSPGGGKKKTARKKTTAAAFALEGSRTASEEARNGALRRLLVQRRADILKEAQAEIAKYIKGENRQLVETALDDGDWSVIDLSEDINLRKLGSHRQTLIKIDTALRKLDEGTYGLCEDCGDEIAPTRLKILPFAIYCRDCQERREEMEAVVRERPPSGR